MSKEKKKIMSNLWQKKLVASTKKKNVILLSSKEILNFNEVKKNSFGLDFIDLFAEVSLVINPVQENDT